jgi:hypothetical protein
MDVVLEKSICFHAGKYTNTKEGNVRKMSQKLGSMVEMFLILFQTVHEWRKPIGKLMDIFSKRIMMELTCAGRIIDFSR